MTDYSSLWNLDPQVLHLNHGSFGVCPRSIVEHQRHIQDEVEADPDRFFITEAEDRLMDAKAELGRFLGVDASTLVWVRNATTAVNAVLRSLPLKQGDQVLVTDHIYNACQNVLVRVREEKGIELVITPVPFPIVSSEQISAAVLDKVTSRTRLVMLDHLTSASALIFPVAEILEELNRLGIASLIDGAHAPGQIPLDLSRLGATYYTGNCHKWLFAPRGCAFLYAAPEVQPSIHPAVISHGSNAESSTYSDYQLRFKWAGTEDLSAYLCVPRAIEFPEKAKIGSWQHLMDRNHRLVVEGREILCSALSIQVPCPESLLGAMATFVLPESLVSAIPRIPILMEVPESWHLRRQLLTEPRWQLWQYVYLTYGIDAMGSTLPGDNRLFMRISAQLYNQREDYQRLGEALVGVMRDFSVS